MFSVRIANSAKFLQMPTETQLLYFHFVMRGDDDGVVEAYPIMKMLGLPEDTSSKKVCHPTQRRFSNFSYRLE